MAYLTLGGDAAADYCTSPDSAVFDVTDLDVRVWCRPAAFKGPGANSVLVDHSNVGSVTAGFRFRFDASNPELALPTVGQVKCTATWIDAGYAAGDWAWVRATVDITAGEVKFYTSPDQASPTWTQLGNTEAIALGAMVASSADLYIGAQVGAAVLQFFEGDMKRVQIYDGIAGSLVFDADPSDTSTWDCPDKLFFTDKANSATVTLQGNATLVGDCPTAPSGNRIGGTGAIRKPPR